jgi:hypothetical protein
MEFALTELPKAKKGREGCAQNLSVQPVQMTKNENVTPP